MTTYKTCPYGESSSCSNSLGALYNTGDHSMSTYVKLPGSFLDQVANFFDFYIFGNNSEELTNEVPSEE